MIRHIIYRVSAYEDAHTSLMAWTADCSDGFVEEKDALGSLAAWLLEKYKMDFDYHEQVTKRCCKKTLKVFSAANYCSGCGCEIAAKRILDSEDVFSCWLADLSLTICDSFGAWSEVEASDCVIWNPWLFPMQGQSGEFPWPSVEEVLVIEQNGQDEIAKKMASICRSAEE
jgi:hypothetical protein